MPFPACPERQRLSRKTVDAINAVYTLKEQSKKSPNDPSLSILLDQARLAEREAERELSDHIGEHRCEESNAARQTA
jgi:hypothetical protein